MAEVTPAFRCGVCQGEFGAENALAQHAKKKHGLRGLRMPEEPPATITLPRSGLVLTKKRGTERLFIARMPHMKLMLVSDPHGEWALARIGRDCDGGSLDECIARLDARVLELRAALLPPDARERIARALHLRRCGIICDKERPPSEEDFSVADAVLDVLGGGA